MKSRFGDAAHESNIAAVLYFNRAPIPCHTGYFSAPARYELEAKLAMLGFGPVLNMV